MNQQERPPLKTISTSGTYQLRLCKPKPEKIKLNKTGHPSAWIFFVDAEGNCVSKYYSVQYGKSLGMLIGKFSGQFIQTLPESASLEQLTAQIDKAVNCIAAVEIEVTENGEWNNKPQYKYKFKTITKIIELQKPDDKSVPEFDGKNDPF